MISSYLVGIESMPQNEIIFLEGSIKENNMIRRSTSILYFIYKLLVNL